jgi:D-glycero-D-manno-heptose 1,7-bisphosphate phosphatase
LVNDRRPAVFLDRDGVLNEAIVVDCRPQPPRSLAEFRLEAGVENACRRLHQAGLVLVVVSNQPDLARGTIKREAVNEVNAALRGALALDAIYICPHDDADACDCRKPAPGMLLAAARELRLDLTRSVMVGDRWRDVEAGRRAGTATVFLEKGYQEPAPAGADLVVSALPEAVDWIVGRLRPHTIRE